MVKDLSFTLNMCFGYRILQWIWFTNSHIINNKIPCQIYCGEEVYVRV